MTVFPGGRVDDADATLPVTGTSLRRHGDPVRGGRAGGARAASAPRCARRSRRPASCSPSRPRTCPERAARRRGRPGDVRRPAAQQRAVASTPTRVAAVVALGHPAGREAALRHQVLRRRRCLPDAEARGRHDRVRPRRRGCRSPTALDEARRGERRMLPPTVATLRVAGRVRHRRGRAGRVGGTLARPDPADDPRGRRASGRRAGRRHVLHPAGVDVPVTDTRPTSRSRQVTPLASVVLAANPSPMTLDGHEHLAAAGSRRGRRDRRRPGPGRRDAPGGGSRRGRARSRAILLTHGHPDHSEGARRLHEHDRRAGARARPGAPARRRGPGRGRCGRRGGRRGAGLGDAGAHVGLAVVPARRRATVRRRPCSPATRSSAAAPPSSPTRTATSATTSRRCAGCRSSVRPPCSPGTDPSCRGPGTRRRCIWRTASSGWTRCGPPWTSWARRATPRQIVELVYADVDQAVWWAAELSVSAQLAYLRGE